MAEIRQERIIQKMRDGPYTISTDGSNDDSSKQYPIVVRTMDSTGTVNSELLSVPICQQASTGENIFKLLNSELEKHKVPWENCLSFGCDNANVMVGANKGVFGFIKRKQPEISLSGCALHLIHIAAKKAAAFLPPFEDILTDIYYYFNKSVNRKEAFKGTQAVFNVSQKKLLKHVPTRWLSIGRCVERLVENWSPLLEYFKSEKQKLSSKKKPESESTYAEKKVEAVYNFLKSPTNKLYAHFLLYAIKIFEELLTGLQADEPKVHVLKKLLLKLIRNLLVCVVKPSAMSNCTLLEVDYQIGYNIKPDSELVIGEHAKEFVKDKESNGLREKKVKEFYGNVKKYYKTAVDYLKAKLPLQNKVLIHAEVADVSIRQSVKTASLEFFLGTYPCLIPASSTKEKLMFDFALYQAYNAEPIEKCLESRMDSTWMNIGNVKDGDGVTVFEELSKVMRGILTIPHSSAHCERIFSCVRKNKTDQRASLSDKVLEALLVVKCSEKYEFTDNELKRLKCSYYVSIKDKK